ncbi:MAG: ABC transporter ATP-binding protein [Firmicutes bacterium]|nr:ABC transporter ATP-binding protein [[Eubacterium] siraeum]MCM1487638.1 ABC transporter ATP-binding protein [Bacillota bacterium]
MIELKDITKVYNPRKRNQYTALNKVSLTVEDGEFLAITGESGSGKSTLLHIIGLLDFPTLGEYALNGEIMGEEKDSALARLRAKEIGFVKQDFALIENYSAIDNVMLPLYPIKAKNKKGKAMKAIKRLGIEKLADKQVSQLSGGEKQRVAIARAIVTNPGIVLADEPTGSLDSKTGGEIFDILTELNYSGVTVIMVTHDKALAQRCGRIITVKDGQIVR